MSKTYLKYRTFQELLDDVSLDFNTFLGESMIEPSQLIKIAQKVNYELGLKINRTKDDIIDINHRKAKLPDDFYVLNTALICHKWKLVQPDIMMGRHTEDVEIIGGKFCPICKEEVCVTPGSDTDKFCKCNRVYTNECGDSFQVIEKIRYEIRYYDEFEHLVFAPDKRIDKDSVNLRDHNSRHRAEIKDGYIYTNIESGRLFINYESNMEDNEGNLLVLDHPLINHYYEYAIKQRLLENLYINGEDVVQRLQLINQLLHPARTAALTLVNTPDFAELKDVHDLNRQHAHKKYYRIFL